MTTRLNGIAPAQPTGQARTDTSLNDAENPSPPHDSVAQIREFAETTLRPRVLDTDRNGIADSVVDELRRAGLLNATSPPEFGGTVHGQHGEREIHEIIAGADPTTWLVWAQHAGVINLVSARYRAGKTLSDKARQVLSGEAVSGAALSDIRRYPDHYVKATKTTGGWIFDGTISWVSGWGLQSVLAVGAVEPGTELVVTALIPTSERLVANPIPLAALSGSRTVRVHLNGIYVPEREVISVSPRRTWLESDTAYNAAPQLFGIAREILAELAKEDHPLAAQIASKWQEKLRLLRTRAYDLTDDKHAPQQERLEVKSIATETISTLANALISSRAGRGLGLNNTAQFWARTALFLRIQGQNDAVKTAQLDILRSAEIHTEYATIDTPIQIKNPNHATSPQDENQ